MSRKTIESKEIHNAYLKLKIISYNINGLSKKYLYPLFFTYLKQFEVIALLETHITVENTQQAEKYFPEYNIHWINATKISRFGRAIGGIMLGVKKSIGVNDIRYEFMSRDGNCGVYISIGHKKILILPLYLRSANWNQDFTAVKTLVEETECENLILVGDLNIRIGEMQQDIVSVYRDSFPAGTEIRKSMDREVNSKGRQYLGLCDDRNLIILNGQTIGDEDGRFTFVSSVGESVNDICSVSPNLLSMVENFSVDGKIWSDHFPITLTLQLDLADTPLNKLKLLPKLMWKEQDKQQYQCSLNANLQHMLSDKTITSLKELTDTIVASARTNNVNQIFTPKKKWFNERCFWARKKAFESLRKFRKTNLEEDKQTYLRARRKYTDICESSKQLYYDKIADKLNGVKTGKEWWRLVKEINNRDLQISQTISAEMFKEYFMALLNPIQSFTDILYAPRLIKNNLLDKDITVEEIKSMLRNVKLNKAPGEDRIPYEYFINATEEFYAELARMYSIMFESGSIDDVFQRAIIFPIHKKGNINDTANYRGISFMNSVAKIFMGILNERLLLWTDEKKIIIEYQAGFRRNYSTSDNIYNLASIVNIKMAEKRKVFAFFVDFKAAFDNVPRSLLMYKLHEMGVSNKYVRILESIYQNTQSAVWTGDELSDYFSTVSGVKQGCLLSPLLFALYLNDIHEALAGGLFIEGINVRTLLYADDIVILAEESKTLQQMIKNLEHYCEKWHLTINMNKSKIMVFRNGGRLSQQDRWVLHGEQIQTVSEYNYLGVILTPQMKFLKHIQNRNIQSKCAINMTWQNFLRKQDISLQQKWNLYTAVCRSVQSYAAQIWGYGYFEEVDKLQRFFLKKVLRLPECAPNYAVDIETDLEDGHIYTLQLHMKYIFRTLFQYKQDRLPHQLTKVIIRRNLFWAKHINDLISELNVSHIDENITANDWNSTTAVLIEHTIAENRSKKIQRALQSSTRLYKYLDHTRGYQYFNGQYCPKDITWIFKARCDLISLNGNQHAITTDDSARCTLCNTREKETFQHFFGLCPILRGYRVQFFGSPMLMEDEIIRILDGREELDWRNLVGFLKTALQYRKLIMSEFA